MPLFPIVGEKEADSLENSHEEQLDWLKNSSFKPGSAERPASDHEALDHNSPTTPEVAEDVYCEEASSGSFQEEIKVKRAKTKHRTHKKERKKSKHSKRYSPIRSDQRLVDASDRSKIFFEDLRDIRLEDAYRLDHQSDPNNVLYESIYKRHIAYYHVKLRFCLGTRVMLYPSKSKSSQQNRYFNTRTSTEPHSSLVRPIEKNFLTEEFMLVPCDDATSVKVEGKLEGFSSIDENTDDSPFTRDATLTESARLNKLVRDEPGDVESWMKLVDHQEKLLNHRVSGEGAENLKAQSVGRKPLLEAQLAVLDNAVKLNPRSAQLVLRRLTIFSELHDFTQTHREWKQVIFTQLNSLCLWSGYLEFLSTHVATFNIKNVGKAYSKCLRMLSGIRDQTIKSHAPEPGTDEAIIDVFLCWIELLLQAGHTERALATVQAQLDLTFFSPTNLPESTPLEEYLRQFEPVFDANVPRLGERNAKGWSQSVVIDSDVSTIVNTDSLEGKEEEILARDEPMEVKWLQMERLRTQTQVLAWRPSPTQTADDCEDPDRIALFSDISDWLYLVNDQEMKELSLRKILKFLGVPIEFAPTTVSTYFRTSNASQIADLWKHRELIPTSSVALMDNVMLSHDFFDFVANLMDQCRSRVSTSCQSQIAEAQLLWIIQRFKNYSAGLNLRSSEKHLKATRKAIKAFLKQSTNRTISSLYAIYGRFEWELGNKKDSIRALDLYLQASGKARFNREYEAVALALSIIELAAGLTCRGSLLDRDCCTADKDRVLHLLCSLANITSSSKSTPASSALLKTQRYLQEQFDHSIEKEVLLSSSETNHYLPLWSNALALFDHFQYGYGAASDRFDSILNVIRKQRDKQDSTSIEQIEHAVVHMYMSLCLHCTLHEPQVSCRPADARVLLDRCLERFPNDAYFISLLSSGRLHVMHSLDVQSWFQRQLHFVGSAEGADSRVLCFLHFILSEHLRWNKYITAAEEGSAYQFSECGFSHRLRTLYARALSERRLRHMPHLWLSSIALETRLGNMNRVKGLLYSAIENCPGVKTLLLESVRILPGTLNEMIELMSEKELRLRTPIEEIEMLLEAKTEADETDASLLASIPLPEEPSKPCNIVQPSDDISEAACSPNISHDQAQMSALDMRSLDLLLSSAKHETWNKNPSAIS